jgi:hypothetical protein
MAVMGPLATKLKLVQVLLFPIKGAIKHLVQVCECLIARDLDCAGHCGIRLCEGLCHGTADQADFQRVHRLRRFGSLAGNLRCCSLGHPLLRAGEMRVA